jgi:hypothetical protein
MSWVAADMSAAPPELAIDALERAVSNERGILAGLRELTAPLVAINPMLGLPTPKPSGATA